MKMAMMLAVMIAAMAGGASAQPSGGWQYSTDNDPLTDKVTTSAFVLAPEGRFFVSCYEGEPIVGFMAKHYFGHYEMREVDYRLDSAPALTDQWWSGDEMASIRDSGALTVARSLAGAQKLVLRAHDWEEHSVTAEFDVTGAAAAVAHILDGCRP